MCPRPCCFAYEPRCARGSALFFATHSALIRKGKSERLSNMKACRTLVILAICALVAGAGAISTHRGNIRGMPVSSAREGAEEAAGESPTSKARGISDFRPAEHAPEDVTEKDIRNNPAVDAVDASAGASSQDANNNLDVDDDTNRNDTASQSNNALDRKNSNSTQNENKQMSEAEEIEARMKDTDAMREFVRGHLENVHGLIQAAHEQLEKEKKEKRARQKEERKRAVEKELRNSVKMSTYMNRLKKRRKQVNKCLDIIHGGADKLYWQLRKQFARVPAGAVCLTLKKIKFPHIPIVGFKEDLFRKYIGWQPPNDGSTIVYYDAVKTHIFRCMCEETDLTRLNVRMETSTNHKKPVDRIETMAEKASEQIEQEMEDESRFTKKQQGIQTMHCL